MRRKDRLVVLFGAVLILAGLESVGLPARSEEVPGPVPAPSAVARSAVSRGNVYPFPWSGVQACLRPFQPGCFMVTELGPKRAVLAYTRFELEGGTLKPQGFRYLTAVTREGSGYELFPIKLGRGREEWVYAVLEQVEGETARIQFLALPAFVTDRARITARVSLELGNRRLQEVYEVDTHDPITLIGLGSVQRVIPSARIVSVAVNGQAVTVRHPDIFHLNLPAGLHRITLEVHLGTRPAALTLQGTLLEPRKMWLIRELDLRVDLGGVATGAELEVRTVGLPPEVWDRFRPSITVAPLPVGEELNPLAIRYRFGPSRELTLRARPRISVGPNNYPVMVTVTAPGPE